MKALSIANRKKRLVSELEVKDSCEQNIARKRSAFMNKKRNSGERYLSRSNGTQLKTAEQEKKR